MNVLSVENLTKYFGDRLLFENLSFGIEKGQKVAIVAKNGNGKSTLLNCLLDKEVYDAGKITFNKEVSIGFLEQSEHLNPQNTILEEIYQTKDNRIQLLKAYNKALENNEIDKLTELNEKIEEVDAWDIEHRIQHVLSILGLSEITSKIAVFSGGQKKRLALAKVLIAEPDFIILDEPTNHLDLDMIEWLENYLLQSKSTILMVTHDRYFLEVVADSILELENQTLYRYKGNFSYYLEKKAERELQHEVVVNKARSLMKSELEWIRRQPKARGTKQKARIDAFHETKKVADQNLNKEQLHLATKMERLGSKIVEMHRVHKAFGTKQIMIDFTYHFKRKERLGIVGKNGTGKSTFLKLILGEEVIDQGKITTGETVVFGNYAQENMIFKEDAKVIDVIREVAEFIPLEKGKEMSAAQFLEKFLFPKSMHYQLVSKLSGGEKRRLTLMRVLMKNPNFLILDEPTNDLDIFVLSVLEDYLKKFDGCLIVVSHDRYFMDKMVDHLFVFNGEGEIKDIIGNYTTYRKYQHSSESSTSQSKIEATKALESQKIETSNNRKLSYKEKLEFEQLEREINELEEEKRSLTTSFSDVSISVDQLEKNGLRLAEIVQLIDAKSERWLELSELQS